MLPGLGGFESEYQLTVGRIALAIFVPNVTGVVISATKSRSVKILPQTKNGFRVNESSRTFADNITPLRTFK